MLLQLGILSADRPEYSMRRTICTYAVALALVWVSLHS
jgi:hypothetical protein